MSKNRRYIPLYNIAINAFDRLGLGSRIDYTPPVVFDILNLFQEDNFNTTQGIFLDAGILETMAQNINGTPIVSGDDQRVRWMQSRVNGYTVLTNLGLDHLGQSYQSSPSRIVSEGGRLQMNIPAGGFVGTMVVSAIDGTAAYPVNIPAQSNFAILGVEGIYPSHVIYDENTDASGVIGIVVIDRTLTEAEINDTINWFITERGGGPLNYSGVENISEFWRNNYFIIEFPLIDSSSVISASGAWTGMQGITTFPLLNLSSAQQIDFAWNNCDQLQSFPLLDLSSAIDARYAWANCSALTTFPAIDMPNATDVSWAWNGCIGLTTFPVIDLSSALNISGAWQGCNALTSFPLIDLSSATNVSQTWNNCTSLSAFPAIDLPNATNLAAAWYNCNGLTAFPLIDLSSAENVGSAWYGCVGLTAFPAIDMPNATNLNATWLACTNLTSFPLIDLSSAENVREAWYSCNNLTTFPAIDLPNVTDASYAWYGCSSLTAFPAIDFSSLTNADAAWQDCTSLVDFPANVFDGCPCVSFINAFTSTDLTETSIDNILVSIESNNTNDGTFNQSGGSAPSVTGEAAITALRTRGWTVTVTGGF